MPRIVKARRKKVKRTAKAEEDETFDPNLRPTSKRPTDVHQEAIKSKLLEERMEKPALPPDPISLYRIYNGTSQRVPSQLSSLNSAAAFIILCDDDRQVIMWIGEQCTIEDRQHAENLAVDILRRDYRLYEATLKDVSITVEGVEFDTKLQHLLNKLFADINAYKNKSVRKERSNDLQNAEVIIGTLEKVNGQDKVKEVGKGTPDENGCVKRLHFVPISDKTVIVVTVGNQFYLWLTKNHNPMQVNTIKRSVVDMISKNFLALKQNVDKIFITQSLRVVLQGFERVMFRQYFKILTEYEPQSSPSSNKVKNKINTAPTTSSPATTPNGQGFSMLSFLTSKASSPAPVKNVTVKQSELRDVEASQIDSTNNSPDVNAAYDDDMLSPDEYFGIDSSFKMNDKVNSGRSLLVAEMLILDEKDNVSPRERLNILQLAATTPSTLFGWQIEIDDVVDQNYGGIYVVTGIKKHWLFRNTSYRISSFTADDKWISIRRGKKQGISVRPMRKVLLMNIE